MTAESVAFKIGLLTAVSSAILQQDLTSRPVFSMTALVVPAVSAVIGGLMSYAVLKTTVHKMEQDVRDMRKDMANIYALLRESMTKLAHVEGRMEGLSQ